jgi:hypothetical protein
MRKAAARSTPSKIFEKPPLALIFPVRHFDAAAQIFMNTKRDLQSPEQLAELGKKYLELFLFCLAAGFRNNDIIAALV